MQRSAESFSRKISQNKKAVGAGAIVLALILAGGGYYASTMNQKKEAPVEESVAEEKESPKMQTDLSLGGLDLDLTIDEMHNRIGQENTSQQDGNYMDYSYDGLMVRCQNNHIVSLESKNDTVETKKGIHQGSTLDDVVQAYGSEYKQSKENEMLCYTYTFQSLGGNNGTLKFTVSPDEHIVKSILVSIPVEKKEEKKEDTVKKGDPSTIEVTYTGGTNSQLALSRHEVSIHVGQKVHIAPANLDVNAGMLRAMIGGNLGQIEPQGCVKFESAGKVGEKGSSTEIIITGQKPGTARFTVVPHYGDWDKATQFEITINP